MTVGCCVRVLEVPASLQRDLPADEWADVSSMLGQVLEVYELDEWGQAWVQQVFPHRDASYHSHSLGLDPHQMERVDR